MSHSAYVPDLKNASPAVRVEEGEIEAAVLSKTQWVRKPCKFQCLSFKAFFFQSIPVFLWGQLYRTGAAACCGKQVKSCVSETSAFFPSKATGKDPAAALGDWE